jgi:tRNA pseudouridine32 synthase/23S rRNA pseudouridine746 synthase
MDPSRALETPLQIVYHDEQLLVLDKPSGLLAVPGRGPDLQDCLSARAQAQFPTALVVHRLDRDTSGLLVMALDAATQRALNRQFAAQQVSKRYVAVVFGSPPTDAGIIDLPMRKDFDNPPRHMIDLEQGRAARTEWRAIERLADRTRLEVLPKTGRSHQIRLHLLSIGHPILGDNLYAPPEALAMSDRLLLHSEELSLAHPSNGREITWRSPCPF